MVATPPRSGSPGLAAPVAAVGEPSPITAVWVGVVAFAFGPVLIAAADASGNVMVFWRLWFGVPILAVLAGVQIHRSGTRPTWSGWRWCLGAGAAFALHQVTFMTALRQTSVVDVTLMNTLAPLVVAV